jgi:hypothetical protein
MMTALLLSGCITVLILVALTRGDRGRETASVKGTRNSAHQNPAESVPCPQLVRQIFSPEDSDFISKLHSQHLSRVYERERRAVALFWVQQVSREGSRIMREHRLASRRAEHLQPSVESILILHYVDLQLTCGCLMFLIWTFGPHPFASLARHAGRTSRFLALLLASVQAGLRLPTPENEAGY